MQTLRYSDFDILGTIKLSKDEVEGLTDYITPVRNEKGIVQREQMKGFVTPVRDKDGNITHYLSRSSLYYQQNLTYTDRQNQHSYLSSLLATAGKFGKRTFVIAENMLNNSARVFYSESVKRIYGIPGDYETARECFLNDCKLVRSILRNEDYEYTPTTLLTGKETTEGRQIELDNKALLDLFARSLQLKNPQDTAILNPGFGSLYLGPFVKLENEDKGLDVDWENIHLSIYAKNSGSVSRKAEAIEKLKSTTPVKTRISTGESSIASYMTNPERFFNKHTHFVVLDDNMGTAETARVISTGLKNIYDCDVDKVATMNNWVNYAKVYNGKVIQGEKVPGDASVVETGESAFLEILNAHNSDAYKTYRTDIGMPDLNTDPTIFRSPLNFPDYHVLKAAIAEISADTDDGASYEGILERYGYGNTVYNDLLTINQIGDSVKEIYEIDSHGGEQYREESPHLVETANNLEDFIRQANPLPPPPQNLPPEQ